MAPRRKKPIHPAHASPGEAVHYLASVCDGAVLRDGYGFSSDDVAIGHHLAQRDEATWEPFEHQHAHRLIRTYQRQLAAAGFQPAAILRQLRPTRLRRRQARKLKPHWAPDPTGFAPLRYWNGARWTHHLANNRPAQPV